MKKVYDVVYSIGDSCSTALYMKKYLQRKYSGPFDWLAGADFERRKVNQYITKYKMLTIDKIEANNAKSMASEKVFSNIHCEGQNLRRLQRAINKLTSKILFMFIPYGPWRKALKDRKKYFN